MEHGFPSPEHPNDADLLEALLRGEPDPHLLRCLLCAQRADAIARNIDPLRTEWAREPFDAAVYRRQSAAIQARLACGADPHRTRRAHFPSPQPSGPGAA